MDHPFATVFPEGRWIGVSTDREETEARLRALSPRDAEAWRRLLDAVPAESRRLLGLLGSPMTVRAVASFALRLARAKGLGGALDTARFLLSSPRRWLTETFESPEVHALLGA